MGGVHGRGQCSARGRTGTQCLVQGICRRGIGQGKGRGRAGEGQCITRVNVLIGALGRWARVRAGREEGEGGGGPGRGVLRTPRSIIGRAGEARGGRRRSEGGGYIAGVHCSTLWSTPIACQGKPLACRARPLCLGCLGRSKQRGEGLGCPGQPVGEGRG